MGKKMKLGTLLLLSLIAATLSFGQHNKDWIKSDQEYFKIEVSEDGVYKIEKTALKTAGMDVDAIDDAHYHLIHHGLEIPILVTTESIIFYGEKAKGDLDIGLYEDVSKQAHQEFSLYTDKGHYYLTHNSTQGLRYSTISSKDVNGLSRISEHQQEQIIAFDEVFREGERLNPVLFHPNMARGEGLQSANAFRTQSFVNATFNVSDKIPGSTGTVKTRVCGTNNNARLKADSLNASGNVVKSFNNHAVIEANTSSWQILAQRYFLGYTSHGFKADFTDQHVSSGLLSLRARADEYFEGTRVFRGSFSVSHFAISYPAAPIMLDPALSYFRFDRSSSDRYIQIENFTASKALVLDLGNQSKIDAEVSNGTVTMRVNRGNHHHKLVVVDESSIGSLTPTKMVFNPIEIPTETELLILSHRSLATSVNSYATYRKSILGGAHRVEVVYIDDIFKQYYYGYHHPLAVKEFFKDLVSQGVALENAFIIGKGVDVKHLKTTDGFDYSLDLVPSIGSPSSDWYYLRYVDPTTIVPPFGISRLAAYDNETVLRYLEKVKQYETLGPEPWRKNVIHISGGKDNDEIKQFAYDMDVLGKILEEPSWGVNISSYGKQSNLTQDKGLTEVIIDEINSGVGLVSYLGHAGSDATEVDIATPVSYGNANRPVVMYLGGCVLGSCYEKNPLLGEEFVGANNGAVSWIASGSFSFQHNVYGFTKGFYENISGTGYGEAVAEQIRQTIAAFMQEGSEQNESQSWFTLIQGDPLIKIYNPDKPDYTISNTDIFIGPENVTAQSKTFELHATLSNLGRAIEKDIDVAYALTFPSGIVQKDTLSISEVYRSKEAVFIIPNTSNEFGNYSVEVSLDVGDSVAEENEGNNSATYNFNLLKNGAFGLFPSDYGIVNELTTELVGQSIDVTSLNNVFLFELDTVPEFNSEWRKQSGEVSAGLIGNWVVQLLPMDSQDYYWRIRMKLANGKLSDWAQKSFSYIANTHSGWAQVDFDQLKNSGTVDIYAEPEDEDFKFYLNTSTGQFRMENHGRNHPSVGPYVFGTVPTHDRKVIRNNRNAQLNGNHTYNGVVCAVFNSTPNGDVYPVYAPSIDGITHVNGEYAFDWMLSTTDIDMNVVNKFIEFLEGVPDGYHILAYSGYYHGVENMPEAFYDALESFGSTEVRTMDNDAIWLFAGTKGIGPGGALDEQVHSDHSRESYGLSVSFPISKYSGSIVSKSIGPSKKWRHLSISTKGFNSDHVLRENGYTLWGVKLNGERTELVKDFRKNSLDLSFIDSKEFPYIQLELSTYNQVDYKPAQPSSWIVTYDDLPEGLVNSQIAYKFNSDTIERGQTLDFEIGYQNISALSFKNIAVVYRIVDKERNIVFSETDTIEILAPGESIVMEKSFSSDALGGSNKLIVLTNPGLVQPEQYAFNNNFERAFFVRSDQEQPRVEVTFDGHRILNGDIVSPSPVILISGQDNNPYFLLDDPSYFKVSLEYPDSGVVQQLFAGSPNTNFYPATQPGEAAQFEFHPEELADGIYYLNVQLTDANGNVAGKNSYRVQFEVIGAKTISNFYPYPNPFSSEMRFVFTLTGDRTPNDIVIQIMTVSGKVVKEIHMDEMGPIKIGHNISDYTWDGTDMYGNRLANGVYLYRVKTVMDQTQMEHRAVGKETAAHSAAFKEGFGKIYILR